MGSNWALQAGLARGAEHLMCQGELQDPTGHHPLLLAAEVQVSARGRLCVRSVQGSSSQSRLPSHKLLIWGWYLGLDLTSEY